MKTPGFITDPLFYLRTLTIISVLSIGLQISNRGGSISDENTSGKNENLEVSLGELHLKATGKNTTDRALNLLLILSDSVSIDLDEKSYHSISLQEKQIMRRLDNSLSMESSPNPDTMELPTSTTPTY
ncbi:MAG: hypothetical protein CM15mV17_1190 [Caudoviricetes sp.]|jgi:hypothetical protein|nr:MAG: hypothetical protein CM15mV17_1190 [Caudoviricetes sp.]